MTGPAVPLSPSVALVTRALADRGMTRRQLAETSGLSVDHVSRLLSGKVPFPRRRSTLVKLARALAIEPSRFEEYRQAERDLEEPTRRLRAAIAREGLDPSQIAAMVPHFGIGRLRAVLRGDAFPDDPAAIAALAAACGLSALDFPAYLPLPDLRDRLLEAATTALDPADLGVFRHLLGKIEAQLVARWTAPPREDG